MASSTAPTGTLTALGGLNPGDFTAGFNPQVIGTPATPFSDATYTGSAVNNKAAVPAPITGATALSGVPGTDSLTANFAVGDTITVNGTVVTFVAAGAVGNQLNITDNVTALLAKIDSITGTANPSTVAGGAITLHTGTDLEPDGHEFERVGIGGARLPLYRDCEPAAAVAPRAPASSSAATRRFSPTNRSAAAR